MHVGTWLRDIVTDMAGNAYDQLKEHGIAASIDRLR